MIAFDFLNTIIVTEGTSCLGRFSTVALVFFVSSGESRVQAHKYLLSTLCTDLVTRIVRFVAEDHMIPVEVQEVTLTSEVCLHT